MLYAIKKIGEREGKKEKSHSWYSINASTNDDGGGSDDDDGDNSHCYKCTGLQPFMKQH